MARVLYLLMVGLAACGEGESLVPVRMALDGDHLHLSDVGSVELLVLDQGPGCARALSVASPLDDPTFSVLSHALFHVDGGVQHIRVPAGRPLLFYAEAFRDPGGKRPRIGRGCETAKLGQGGGNAVSITLSASDD
jgi:hypothetical protein